MNTTSEKRADGLTGGLVLIAIGAVFLLLQQGVLRVAGILDWWPLIVVAIGASKLIGGEAERRRGGLWLLFVGGWLLANTNHWFGLKWSNSWPVMVIGVGVMLTFGALFPVRKCNGAEPASGGTYGR